MWYHTTWSMNDVNDALTVHECTYYYLPVQYLGSTHLYRCSCQDEHIWTPDTENSATMSHVKPQAQEQHIKQTVSVSENDSNVMSTTTSIQHSAQRSISASNTNH